MKIELFGAAFDPPHRGHFQVIATILALNLCDEVLLIPSNPLSSSKRMAGNDHRLTMLQLFLQDFKLDRVKIEEYELKNPTHRYTYDTLIHFSDTQMLNTFAWIVGSDKLQNFHRWHKSFELLQKFRVHVYPRPGFPMIPLYAGMIALSGVPETAVSSSVIRAQIRNEHDVSNVVGQAVYNYILERQLYH